MSRCCIVNSLYGPLIVNSLDVSLGTTVIKTGTHEQDAINIGLNIIGKQLELRGHGVSVLDVGANIGVNTVAWAKSLIKDNVMVGSVIAFEPQERVYYIAAGNIALNNLLNARICNAVVSNKSGMMKIPKMDHSLEGSFGGLSMLESREADTGQKVSFDEKNMVDMQAVMLDSFQGRVDFIKMDVEGMEPYVLDGAQKLIARERPVILAEYQICNPNEIKKRLKDYNFMLVGINVCAVPEEQTEMLEFIKSTITYKRR